MNVATKHRISKLFAVALAFLMMAVLLAGSLPAYADNTPVSGSTVSFNKYLVMESEANVPPVTFSYTIRAGGADEGVGNGIYAGPMTGTTVPTVGTAVFSSTDNTDLGKPTDDGSVTTGYKYATKTVNVDLSGVSFTAPGVYRYVITETSNNDSVPADPTNVRYLDVQVGYVNDTSNALEIEAVAIYKAGEVTKTDNFTSELTTYTLTLEKQVTGNQGDRSKAFEFTVNVGGVSDTVYTVDRSNAPSAASDPETLTAGQEATYHLADGEYIVIKGIAGQVSYTITEEDYSTDGYTTTNNDNTGVGAAGNTTTNKTLTDDHTVTFENHKQGTVPTGIIMEVAPFALLAVIVGAAFVLLVATRKHRSR